MNLDEFPFPDDLPYFEQPWTLDAVQYIMRFQWNTRQSLWFLSVCDATATPIVAGIALHSNRDLLSQYTTLLLPKGLLFVYDNTGKAQSPSLNSFSSTHQLLYVS